MTEFEGVGFYFFFLPKVDQYFILHLIFKPLPFLLFKLTAKEVKYWDGNMQELQSKNNMLLSCLLKTQRIILKIDR